MDIPPKTIRILGRGVIALARKWRDSFIWSVPFKPSPCTQLPVGERSSGHASNIQLYTGILSRFATVGYYVRGAISYLNKQDVRNHWNSVAFLNNRVSRKGCHFFPLLTGCQESLQAISISVASLFNIRILVFGIRCMGFHGFNLLITKSRHRHQKPWWVTYHLCCTTMH